MNEIIEDECSDIPQVGAESSMPTPQDDTPQDSKPSATPNVTISQIPPPDKEFLKIKNLDTGEEYIIGENDPDFEFDTFPLSGDIGTEGNETP